MSASGPSGPLVRLSEKRGEFKRCNSHVAACIFVLQFLQLTVKSIKLFSFYLSFTTGTIALLKARLLCTSQFYFSAR